MVIKAYSIGGLLLSPAFEVYIKYLPYYEDKEEGKEEYENEFKRE